MQNLNVALIQADLHWQNPEKNRLEFTKKITAINEPVDVIVLPEMFTTGFTMDAKNWAETMNGPTVAWMLALAKKTRTVLAGSLIIKENGYYFNRFIWAAPQSELYWYDKRHLFRMAEEHKVYRAGNQLLTVTLNGWKIRPFVCYDLRFPVWSRNVNLAYDLLIYVANWPEPRKSAWRTLLQARAAENQAYVIGVNRVGSDGSGIRYSGESLIIDPKGNVIVDSGNKETVVRVTLSRTKLEHFRQKFPAWKDADRFNPLSVKFLKNS